MTDGPTIGHNSGEVVSVVAKDQLRAFIERVELLEEDKKAVADDIKEVYTEAKGNGFDTKVMRKLVQLRKMDMNTRLEQQAMLDLYMHALGMTPIEAAEASGMMD